MIKENERSVPRGVHVYAVVVAVATFLLVIVGGLVTSTGSGLSVPDWPLSYGKVLPPMEGGVLYEHGHRMVAAAVGLMTIILMVLLLRRSRRTSIRALGIAAAVAVVLPGLLGGLTVLMELWMRHAGAGVAIPDFPLALGRVIPPLDSFPVTIHFVHRLGALAVAVTAVITAVVFLRNPKVTAMIKTSVGGLLGLVVVQIILGGAVVLNLRPVGITTTHVAVGSLILALSAVLWLESYRARVSLTPARESAPSHDLVGDLAKGGATS
jgi:heme A synthase